MNILRCEFIGEAVRVKNILLFVFLLMPTIIFGQDINIQSLKSMNNEDFKTYLNQVQEEGYSLDQIKIIAKAQGLSDFEIAELERRVADLGLNELTNDTFETEGVSTSMFGLTENSEPEEAISLDETIFGSSFFNNPNISSAPSLNLATPESYEIGPGDELAISIWGAAQNEYTSKITREGYLKIERIGPVYLSGLTIAQAKYKLKDKLSKIYSGINSSFNKVFFDLTLLNSRSIVVNIAGNVVGPGTYTLSSLANPLNALYAAGGPNENGSYREITVIRGGKEVHSIDLYDYFIRGALKSFSLRDQDIILIPSYKNRIFLKGEFKTIGVFELKDSESISDLLLYNGGISSRGVKNQVYVEKVDGLSKSVRTVEKKFFKEFILNDGDIVEAREVGDEIKNLVSVEGAVMIPGRYELNKNLNVRSLIKSAGGFKENALRTRGYIIRNVDGFPQEAKTVDLEKALSLDQNYSLRNNDKLIIASTEELTGTKLVSISGETKVGGNYPFFKGMTVIDLILMSNGVTEKGSFEDISIYRSTYDKTQVNPVETINISLNEGYSNLISDQNIELLENDLVVIRSKLGYQPKEFVSVSGLVKRPGNYAIKSNEYSVFDLIKDFKGFLPNAELNGIKLKRKVENEEIMDLLNSSDIESAKEVDLDEFIEIGLDINRIIKSNGQLSDYNLTLKSGDEIIVPKADNSIEVSGSVQKPTAMAYKKGLTTSAAINAAGGFGLEAKKSRVFVVYQNGSIKSTKSFLIFRKYPKLLPGSKVFVPKKAENNNKTSVGEIVGYTTSLVSIIALIKSL
jgi:protein involved in polysaccharide export with SLBB domain